MSHKRKKPVRLLEGDLDASNIVGIRRVRKTGRDGRQTVQIVEESVHGPSEGQVGGSQVASTSFEPDNGIFADSSAMENVQSDPNPQPVLARKPTKRQKDYIQQFVDRIDSILEAMMSREHLKEAEWKCRHCKGQNWAVWRCADCMLAEPMCRHCMRSTHMATAFHRIKRWTGTHYKASSLWAVGIYILVRHRHDLSICDTLQFYADCLEKSEQETDQQEQLELERLFSLDNIPHQEQHTPHTVNTNEDYMTDFADEANADAERRSNAEFDAYLEALQGDPGAEILEPEDDEELIDEEGEADTIQPYLPEVQMPQADMFNNTYVRVVHANGIHQLGLVSCNCHGEDTVPLDLIALQLIPTSFKKIRTLFTGELLDAFRLSSLELKASAYQFYRLLRRYTNPMAPGSVVNLYNEFRRMTRLWRWTKKLKWAGFAGHNRRSAREVKPTELANFCPACPQIGINVANDWEADPNRFVYQRIFVADGNFKADHVRARQPSSDVWLSEGGCFVPKNDDYHNFLRIAMETSTKAPCETTFRAITNSLLASKACDVTGVVGIACARHGCYAPSALCDLYRGEQQKNVDFALLAAIYSTGVDPKQGVMLLYDIICQYIIHLKKRIGKLLPAGLEISPGIGMFHVHAHKDECFFRYAPSLIPGAGCVCGEILESLWSALNTISPTVRTATLAHRAEMLDDHTGDSNHKKLLGMVQFLVHQYFNARKNKTHYNNLYARLNGSTNPEYLQKWRAQICNAEAKRLKNASAMDIYGADLALTATNDSGPIDESAPFTAVDLWIQFALVVEEKQIEVRRKLKSWGKYITPSQQEELERLRDALTVIWSEMAMLQRNAGAEELLPEIIPGPVPHLDWEDVAEDDDENIEMAGPVPTAQTTPNQPLGPPTIEFKHLPLPSYNTADQRYRQAEIKARIHQANRNLSALRELIVSKAFQYADVLRQAPRKLVKTRSRTAVYNISQDIMYHTQVYTECRSRLKNLQPSPDLLKLFQELKKDDVRTSTAFIDPNSAGSTRIKLSWIWHSVTRRLDPLLQQELDNSDNNNIADEQINADADMNLEDRQDGQGEPVPDTPAMVEYKRVHWLRARAQSARWDEELTYVDYEMKWTVKYFQYKSRWWKDTISSAQNAGEPLKPGQAAYAERQSALWLDLMSAADKSFQHVNSNYGKI